MTSEEILKNELKGEGWLFSPNIPSKKINGACSVYNDLDPNTIIALFDNTIFGSGKAGLVLTGANLYYKSFADSSHFFKIEYDSIESIKVVVLKKEQLLEIKTKDGNTYRSYEESISDFDYSNFIEVMNTLISSNVDFKEEAQSIPLDSEAPIVKINFIKILSNISFNSNNIICDKSYAELTQLISRLNFSKEDRFDLRSYMLNENNRIENDILLSQIKESMPENRLHEVHISLLKEAINIFRVRANIKPYTANSYKKDEQCMYLKNLLSISDGEVSLIEDSIISDEKIFLDRDISDDKIKELFTDMAGKAAAVGVPLAAVYLTGTIGFSAAGLTSGLAALGMGGILGFSSMVTGIGVALVIGVVSYKLVGKGVKAITGDDSEKYKQREFFLQNVMKQSQKTLNLLIEDINYITSKVFELVKSSEKNDIEIEKLYRQIEVLANSQSIIMDRSRNSEKEKTIIHLPKYLDVGRLESLTSSATLKDIRDIVLEFYTEEQVEKDGELETKMVLHDENFSLEELEELLETLKEIGYNDIKTLASSAINTGLQSMKKGLGKVFDNLTN